MARTAWGKKKRHLSAFDRLVASTHVVVHADDYCSFAHCPSFPAPTGAWRVALSRNEYLA